MSLSFYSLTVLNEGVGKYSCLCQFLLCKTSNTHKHTSVGFVLFFQ